MKRTKPAAKIGRRPDAFKTVRAAHGIAPTWEELDGFLRRGREGGTLTTATHVLEALVLPTVPLRHGFAHAIDIMTVRVKGLTWQEEGLTMEGFVGRRDNAYAMCPFGQQSSALIMACVAYLATYNSTTRAKGVRGAFMIFGDYEDPNPPYGILSRRRLAEFYDRQARLIVNLKKAYIEDLVSKSGETQWEPNTHSYRDKDGPGSEFRPT